ncbi:hypothetical protein G9C98_008509 [Cotesia typhae]|uniref:Neurotransmitter-gated ion-channel ligand-binding domain-containing protein n=1 Tax=Cotesia typhae TaxID=2053667 RepID=A0A8J5QWH9_9HYME|nr:hypothetical protein G9C98_008509 [Cotesia typhae]
MDILYDLCADPQYSSAVINTNVIISHTGQVVWLSHGIFRSSCNIDVEFFPFDEQKCLLKWASWTYDGYQVELESQSEQGDISNYQANGEFDLVNFTAQRNIEFYSCCPEPYPDITYEIRLYYGVSICLVSFASGLAVVTLNFHHRGLRGSKVSPLVKSLVLEKLARLVFLKFSENQNNTHLNEYEDSTDMTLEQNTCPLHYPTLVHSTIEKNERRLSDQDQREQTELEWKQIALVSDRVLLCVFFLTTAISTAVILSGSPPIEETIKG